MMKTFLKVIAWVGFGIVSLGMVIALITTLTDMFPKSGSYPSGVDFGHPIAMVLAIVGVPLMLIGGLIAKPKRFWLLSIIVSSLYIIAFIPSIQNLVFYLHHTERDFLIQRGWIFTLLWRNLGPLIPGIVGIAEGILIWRIEARNKAKQQLVETPVQQ